jgi:isoquinoline 1-oxidoreductase subunit beta
LAETPWAAFDAHRALASSVSWTRTGTAWGFDSDKGLERFAADAKNPRRMSTEWSRIGDPRAQMPKAASTMEAEYRYGSGIPLRLRLSRADGAVERHRVGIAGG